MVVQLVASSGFLLWRPQAHNIRQIGILLSVSNVVVALMLALGSERTGAAHGSSE